MINTQPIEEILEVAIYSGKLKDENPLSLLMVGKPEVGKTSIAMKFAANRKDVFITTDTCYANMVNETLPKVDREGISHIIIPDFLKLLMKKQSTSDHLVTLLNSLMEEGVFNIGFHNSNRQFNGLRCGIITAITDGVLRDHRRNWERIGFLSRCMPVSYSYAPNTVSDIFSYLQQEDYHEEKEIKINTSKNKKSVEGDDVLFQQLEKYARGFGQCTNTYGFRYQKHFQVMAKANALKNKRNKVTQEDIDKVIQMTRYINLDQVQL